MTARAVAFVVVASLVVSSFPHPGSAIQAERVAPSVESAVPVEGISLHSRVVGHGLPAIVLHGGPDFDHRYLLPELDQFQDVFRLIYYDQRGRGESAENVRAEDVTLASDLADLDRVREHFGLDEVVLLGHSWGTVLALEYALRHPERVSHLVLMNPAPASARDVALLREAYLARLGPAMDRQREILASAGYEVGDPESVTARYRIHFSIALSRTEDYERLMDRMQTAFRSQGPDGIVKARAVEDRLMRDTWANAEYDLIPRLSNLRIPTLVITGEDDFIPTVVAERVAEAMSDARLVKIPQCGHFAYLECPGDVRGALNAFLRIDER